MHPLTTGHGSPQSGSSRMYDSTYGYGVREFEIERGSPRSSQVRLAPPPPTRRLASDYNDIHALQTHLPVLFNAKSRPFSVSGQIPLDPANLVVFFRSKGGITHSLDFPIDIDHDLPPALDVLMAACCPFVGEIDGYQRAAMKESLFYPPNLPLSATLEIANHPILDAVRNTLFSSLPPGHYLSAMRDRLEVVPKGGRIYPQPKSGDSRVATIIVTLPAKYRGGALVVRDVDGTEEVYYGSGRSGSGSVGQLEWTAFMGQADYEIEEVTRGCRLTISYAVFLRTFGPAGIQPDPLITPSDRFLDVVAPILNICRGKRVSFYLNGEYGVNPGEVLAESIVPLLKGADSLLYHALKLYKLAPELRWTAGGYIWPVDAIVECADDVVPIQHTMPGMIPSVGPYGSPTMQAQYASLHISPEMNPSEIEQKDNLRWRVENSGAIPLAETDIMVLGDIVSPEPNITKERVPFVSGGKLEKLVVNIMLVVFIP